MLRLIIVAAATVRGRLRGTRPRRTPAPRRSPKPSPQPTAYTFDVKGSFATSSWFLSFPPDRGVGSGMRVVQNSTKGAALVCVPPKCGNMAMLEVLRGRRLEWWGEPVDVRWDRMERDVTKRSDATHRSVAAWLEDPDRVRVAVLRHPVERVLSSMRAFGSHDFCPSCRTRAFKEATARLPSKAQRLEAAYLHFARKDLPSQQRLPCDDQRVLVNQHFRALRCFCGFQLPGMANRTSILRFGDAADIESLATIVPNARSWNRPRFGSDGSLSAVEFLSPRHRASSHVHSTRTSDAASNYSSELFAAITSAVADDLAFLHGLGLFAEPYPPPP